MSSNNELVGLFDEPVTYVVNIGDFTPKGLSISQRVKLWEGESPRHKYIGRGSVWGNPFSHLDHSSATHRVTNREEALVRYKQETLPILLPRLEELRGMILGCWCKPQACHGDILIQALYLK